MTTFPPTDYIPTKSAIPGIAVYMPKPPDEKHQPVVEFSCPQCSASTAYSAENGGLTCTYCGYYEPPQQETVGKAAEEFEFTVETMERVAHGWGAERMELACNRCSAHTTHSTDMLTHTCPFCGSNQVVQVKAPQDVLRPRFLVPFTVTQDNCREKTAVWLGNSWVLPKDLQKLARTATFAPIYIPFWTFDANTNADWKAEVGHRRTRTVTRNGRRTTESYTEWRWESGNVKLFIDDLLVNGSNKVSPHLLSQMRGFNLHELVAYDPTFLAGIQAQAYDIGLEEAWELGRQQMRERTKKSCVGQATSNRIRNFSMNLDFSNESWRYVLLPIYLATYHYNNQPYQVMVNGQNGVVAGQRPVDWMKVLLAAGAALSPSLILGLIAILVYYFSSDEQATQLLGFVAFGAMIAALGFIIHTVYKAVKMDDI